ncbi:alpha-2 adrenergic receptor [Trichonephila clavipes]|nr:alpha-2 adrenergic receptor [Trichonephila clavipes]
MHLWISFIPNAAVLFVDVAIQPEVRFMAKQNSLMEIGKNGNLALGPFDESTPCLMIVLMKCQTKLRINHLTAVKSVAILESNANLNIYTWKKHSLYYASLKATMMIDYNTIADDSTHVVKSKEDVLKAAVSATPPQPSAVKW